MNHNTNTARTMTTEEPQIIRWVESARRGNRDAFGRLVTHFEPMVFGVVLRRLRNRSEARETTQDVFLRAFRKLSQLRDPERFAGWLRRIAVRMAINRAVRQPNEAFCPPESVQGLQIAALTPLEGLLHEEETRRVWTGLKRLRDLDRRTLIAFYFEGHSLKEMSTTFGSPVGTIKRRLHTARNRLRTVLTEKQPA